MFEPGGRGDISRGSLQPFGGPGLTGRRFLAVAGLLASQLLFGCVTTGDVTDERFVRFFDELAFGSEAEGGRRDRLLRWQGPLAFETRGDPAFDAEARRIVGVVARMAALPDPPVETGGAPVTIVQEPPGTLFPVNRDRVDCYVQYRRDGGRIVGADIHIAAANGSRRTLCLYHELLHTLGLGHSGAIASVMSRFHGNATPTRWDVMAVRMLMSDRLSPGMRRTEVLAVVVAELPALRAWPDMFEAREAATARLSGGKTR